MSCPPAQLGDRRIVIPSWASSSPGGRRGDGPPLRPFQPAQRMAAPVSTVRVLGRGSSRSLARRGPIQFESMKPAVPDERWMA